MRMHSIATVAALAFLTAAVALAQVDPETLERLHKGEKYGEYTRAKITVRRLSAKSEEKHVERIVKARAEYQASLEALEKLYEDQGAAEGLRRVKAEMDDFKSAHQFTYQYWEDRLPELTVKEKNAAADKMLLQADELRKSLNPFNRRKRCKAATKLYRQILVEYPSSTASAPAAYGMGEVCASMTMGEYRRAVKFFELCYVADPASALEPLYRAARVLDSDLADHDGAARYYYMTSKLSPKASVRRRALRRLSELHAAGFGWEYRDQEPSKKTDKETDKETDK